MAPFSMAVLRIALVAGLLVALADNGGAQTPPLAEVARKERERRELLGDAPAKVYTNADLQRGGRLTTGSPETAAAALEAQAAQEAAEQDETREPPRDEDYWRARIAEARAQLERSRLLKEALQTRINALTTDFVNRDDPSQRAAIEQDRQRAVAELSRVDAEIAGLEQEIREIEEEARREGVPPGWLR